jgi:PPP family 3-phenylpropionic acid transporter
VDAAVHGTCATGGVVRTLIADRNFVLFLGAGGLAVASHAAYYGFSALYWRSIGYDAFTVGVLWAIGVVAEIVLFWRFVNPAGAREATALIAAGAAGGVMRWALMAVALPLPLLLAVQLLHAASFAMVHLGAMAFIRSTVAPSMRSTAQTLYSAVAGGGLMFAATMLAGCLYGTSPAAMFIAMAGIAALALAFALALRRRTVAS